MKLQLKRKILFLDQAFPAGTEVHLVSESDAEAFLKKRPFLRPGVEDQEDAIVRVGDSPKIRLLQLEDIVFAPSARLETIEITLGFECPKE